MIEIIAASTVMALLAAFVIWLNVIGRRERARRAKLPPEERRRLADEDAKWSQEYGF
jgi:cytochrome c-type biogenesis protein CcmH/NrfF